MYYDIPFSASYNTLLLIDLFFFERFIYTCKTSLNYYSTKFKFYKKCPPHQVKTIKTRINLRLFTSSFYFFLYQKTTFCFSVKKMIKNSHFIYYYYHLLTFVPYTGVFDRTRKNYKKRDSSPLYRQNVNFRKNVSDRGKSG